jgi:hypothetical protein
MIDPSLIEFDRKCQVNLLIGKRAWESKLLMSNLRKHEGSCGELPNIVGPIKLVVGTSELVGRYCADTASPVENVEDVVSVSI